MKKFKIVVYVPESDADKLREAMGNAGAGKIGNYSFCTFSIKGTGSFSAVQRGMPFGQPSWVDMMISKHALESTVRQPGRPKRN